MTKAAVYAGVRSRQRRRNLSGSGGGGEGRRGGTAASVVLWSAHAAMHLSYVILLLEL